jgi:surface polysaccharide O-acyltransferase-like enzyme
MSLSLPLPRHAARAVARPTAELRDSIEVARVALVIGLVFLHYFNFPTDARPPFQGIDPARHQLATFVNGFLTFFFFSAVPLLSAISGWLFFGFQGDPQAAIGRRIAGRMRSLLLPLVLWNAMTLAVAALAQRLVPQTGFAQQFGVQVAQAGPMELANALLGLTALPIAFQFWFVRDLFVTVLCAPLLWVLLRRAPLAGAVLLGGAWLAGFTFGIFIRTDVLFFFYLGALVRRRGIDPRIGAQATLLLLAAFSLLTALRSLAPLAFDLQDPATAAWIEVATRMTRPVGVLACWGACLHLAAMPSLGALARLGGFAFFLHAAHYPVIALVKDLLWRVTPGTGDGWLLLHYGASVALTVALVFSGGWLLHRLWPAAYGVLAGGRSLA